MHQTLLIGTILLVVGSCTAAGAGTWEYNTTYYSPSLSFLRVRDSSSSSLGYVCHLHFTQTVADVACRSLGFASTYAFFDASTRTVSPYKMFDLNCTGTETALDQCSFATGGSASLCYPILVSCQRNMFTLDAAAMEYQRNSTTLTIDVKPKSASTWTRICSSSANVVPVGVVLCKGIGAAGVSSYSSLYNTGEVQYVNVACRGHEKDISLCTGVFNSCPAMYRYICYFSATNITMSSLRLSSNPQALHSGSLVVKPPGSAKTYHLCTIATQVTNENSGSPYYYDSCFSPGASSSTCSKLMQNPITGSPLTVSDVAKVFCDSLGFKLVAKAEMILNYGGQSKASTPLEVHCNVAGNCGFLPFTGTCDAMGISCLAPNRTTAMNFKFWEDNANDRRVMVQPSPDLPFGTICGVVSEFQGLLFCHSLGFHNATTADTYSFGTTSGPRYAVSSNSCGKDAFLASDCLSFSTCPDGSAPEVRVICTSPLRKLVTQTIAAVHLSNPATRSGFAELRFEGLTSNERILLFTNHRPFFTSKPNPLAPRFSDFVCAAAGYRPRQSLLNYYGISANSSLGIAVELASGCAAPAANLSDCVINISFAQLSLDYRSQVVCRPKYDFTVSVSGELSARINDSTAVGSWFPVCGPLETQTLTVACRHFYGSGFYAASQTVTTARGNGNLTGILCQDLDGTAADLSACSLVGENETCQQTVTLNCTAAPVAASAAWTAQFTNGTTATGSAAKIQIRPNANLPWGYICGTLSHAVATSLCNIPDLLFAGGPPSPARTGIAVSAGARGQAESSDGPWYVHRLSSCPSTATHLNNCTFDYLPAADCHDGPAAIMCLDIPAKANAIWEWKLKQVAPTPDAKGTTTGVTVGAGLLQARPSATAPWGGVCTIPEAESVVALCRAMEKAPPLPNTITVPRYIWYEALADPASQPIYISELSCPRNATNFKTECTYSYAAPPRYCNTFIAVFCEMVVDLNYPPVFRLSQPLPSSSFSPPYRVEVAVGTNTTPITWGAILLESASSLTSQHVFNYYQQVFTPLCVNVDSSTYAVPVVVPRNDVAVFARLSCTTETDCSLIRGHLPQRADGRAAAGNISLGVTCRQRISPFETNLSDVGAYNSTISSARTLVVFVNNEPGYMCADGFDLNLAKAACNSMGLGYSTANWTAISYNSELPIHARATNRSCPEHSTLKECSPSMSFQACPSLQIVAVNCQGSRRVGSSSPLFRLAECVNGRGRLEVRKAVGAEWGTVCDDGFSRINADVACRSMGVEFASADYEDTSSGSGPILMDDVRCKGTESNLWECEFSEHHNCGHSEDIGLYCGTCPTNVPLSDGELAGIIIGSIVGFIALVVIVGLCCFYCND